ncbi:hypothetical protein [Candidatus Regiella endosymbiont of Tuberolachnus salignus]|uniref:hypothetical protein n=1 Tax=Candidatus Regiella endosymbiont of Tuberolachnus salignus TaxID=3077956 RepID=UPI0030D56817
MKKYHFLTLLPLLLLPLSAVAQTEPPSRYHDYEKLLKPHQIQPDNPREPHTTIEKASRREQRSQPGLRADYCGNHSYCGWS